MATLDLQNILGCIRIVFYRILLNQAREEMALHIELRMDASADAEEIRKSFRNGAFGNEEFVKAYSFKEGFDDETCVENENVTCSIESLIDILCKEFGITNDELCSSEKRRELVQARGVLARAAQMKKELGLRSVCQALQKRHGTVSRLAAAIRKNQELENLAICLVNSAN